ncbi:MAG: TonB-dependent receptor [Gammaproteobacteria bacterium]
MRRFKVAAVRAALSIACTFVLLSAAYARADEPVVRPFDIGPQSLAAALSEFARQSHQEILFSPGVVANKSSSGARGTMQPLAALQLLLNDSGLTFKRTPGGAILVGAPRAGEAEPARLPSGSGPRATNSQDTSPIHLAQAEESSGPQESARRKSGELDEVVVTGKNPQSTLAQGVIPRTEDGPLPFQVITHDEIVRSGASSAAELLRRLPQNYAAGLSEQRASLVAGSSESSLNLRGFGGRQSLVLLNDRRVGASDGGGSNSLVVPLAAVERVEVLAGAASGIYGARALGGVVNFILRTDFVGSEVSASYGNTGHGDAGETRASFIVGQPLFDNRLNVLLAGEVAERERLTVGERGYRDDVMQRQLALSPAAIFNGPPLADTPANIRVTSGTLGIPGSNATFASVPAGYDGINRGASSYTGTAGTYNLDRNYGGSSNANDLRPPRREGKVFLQAVFNFSDALSAFAEGLYSYSQVPKGPEYYDQLTATVPATNPFNPFGMPVQVSFTPIDFGGSLTSSDEARRTVLGLKGLFGRTWKWSVDYTDWNETTNFLSARPVNSLLNTALQSSDPATAYNPFADLRTQRPNSPALLASMINIQSSDIKVQQRSFGARLSGDLWSLPGGPLRTSIGVESREEEGVQTFAQSMSPSSIYNPVERKVNAVFGEISAPLIGAENGVPFVRGLELALAARFEDYRDSISSVNPTAGVKWEITQGVALRGSYSTGFIPPAILDLTASTLGPLPVVPNQYRDVLRNNEFVGGTEIDGGNPNLKEEGADYYSYGVMLTPPIVPGLRVTVDYYQLDKRDAITTLTIPTLLANEAYLPGRIVRAAPNPGDPAGMPGPITFLDARSVNASDFRTSGLDAALDYAFTLPDQDSIALKLAGTKVTRFERRILPASPLADLVNQVALGGPVRFQGSLGVTWEHSALTAGATLRHIAHYAPTNAVLDGSQIGASQEVDLLLGYAFGEAQGGHLSAWTRGLDLSFGAINVFDRRPPFESTNGYSLFNDPRQRFMYLRLTKRFD